MNELKVKEYSKIVSVEVMNFMVYTHAVLNFDDLNIINIKGYNSSGKSTMLKAIAVCLMNMYPKAQTKFIRHGEKYFRIVVKFDDGVTIVRDKYITGQSLYEVYKDDVCVFTTKEGGKLTKVEGVPQVVQDYLGLCIVSTGCLNYQVRQDRLWLIETTGSDNYNSLNEILKSEELSRANALLNSDKNALNSEITGIEASLQETKLSLMEVGDYSIELLSNLKVKESVCKELKSKYLTLKGITDTIELLNNLPTIPEVESIDVSQLNSISSIDTIIGELGTIVEYPDISKLQVDRVADITRISNILETLKGIDTSVPEVTTIDVEGFISLGKIASLIEEIKSCVVDLKKLEGATTQVSSHLNRIVEQGKKQGIKYVQCDSCGTYMAVNT